MILDRATYRSWVPAAVIAALPLVVLAASEILRAIDAEAYVRLFDEDGPAEYAQAGMFFVGGLMAASMARTFRRRGDRLLSALHWLLAAGLVFITMEEISWGQRLLSIDTPDGFAAYNWQGEINLHNTVWLQSPDSWSWFDAVLGTLALYAEVAWVFVPASLISRTDGRISFVVPGWYLAPYFVPWRDLCSVCFSWVAPWNWQTQEATELVFSSGALLFLVIGRRRLAQWPGGTTMSAEDSAHARARYDVAG